MDLSEDIKALSRGPIKIAYRGTGYLVNGFRFHTEKREKKSQTQNSGVYVAATTRGYSSARDSNPREEIVEYFGILEDIIELNYNGDHKVVLFKCRWYDSIARDKGVKTDQYGYTLVHSNKFGSKEEPFVLPSQVEQLFYVDDHRDKDWRVVIRTKPRDMCDSAEAEVDTDDLTLQVSNSANTVTENEEDNYIWARENIDPEVVDEGTRGSRIKKRKHDATKKQKVDSFMVDEELNEDDVLISEDEEEWLDEEDEDEREEDEDEEYEED